MNTLDLTADTIQVSDIIERIEELEAAKDDEREIILGSVECEERDELNALLALLEELKGRGGDEKYKGDWYPQTLIRDSHFEAAMDELLEDIDDLPKDLPCYLKITVDYRALQMDYSSVEIDDVTYWFR